MHASRAPSPGISSVSFVERPQRLALNPSIQRQRVVCFSAQTRWCGRAFAVQGGKNQTSTRGCCVIPASDQARAPDKHNKNIYPRQQRTRMLQIPEAHGSHRGNPQQGNRPRIPKKKIWVRLMTRCRSSSCWGVLPSRRPKTGTRHHVYSEKHEKSTSKERRRIIFVRRAHIPLALQRTTASAYSTYTSTCICTPVAVHASGGGGGAFRNGRIQAAGLVLTVCAENRGTQKKKASRGRARTCATHGQLPSPAK